MTFDASKVTHETRILVGAMQINAPYKDHYAGYECAAWWEERETEKGVHPIYLSRRYNHPNHLTLTAHIKAKVTDDYFPALWGGVAIGKEPTKAKHIGEERTLHRDFDPVEVIIGTGNSPGGSFDVFLHPSWWKVFADEAVAELRLAHERFPFFWDNWSKLDKDISSFTQTSSQKSLAWTADDEYRSKVGMIAHFGQEFEKWGRRIEKINWHSQYHKVNSRYNTDYNRELYVKNTEWTKALNITINE